MSTKLEDVRFIPGASKHHIVREMAWKGENGDRLTSLCGNVTQRPPSPEVVAYIEQNRTGPLQKFDPTDHPETHCQVCRRLYDGGAR